MLGNLPMFDGGSLWHWQLAESVEKPSGDEEARVHRNADHPMEKNKTTRCEVGKWGRMERSGEAGVAIRDSRAELPDLPSESSS